MKKWGMGILVLGIMFGVGLAVLTDVQDQVHEETFTSGNYTPADSLPTNYTVSPVGDGVVENSETLYLDETGDGQNLQALDKGTNYSVVSYSNGTFTLESVPGYNTSDGDQILTEYDYKTNGEASVALDDTISAISEFTGWFGLIVLVVVAAIIIRLVTNGFGNRRGMRRGRA